MEKNNEGENLIWFMIYDHDVYAIKCYILWDVLKKNLNSSLFTCCYSLLSNPYNNILDKVSMS